MSASRKSKSAKKSYENSINLNLKLITCAFAVLVVMNLVLPLHEESRGYKHFIQYIIIALQFYGCLNAYGFLFRYIPMIPIASFRLLQLILGFIFKGNPMTWWIYIILVALDMLLIALFIIDDSSYEYVSEIEER